MFFAGNNTQKEKVSHSFLSAEEQSSKPLNILVHFECGELEFPMRITTNDFGQFYDKVVSVIKSKVSDFKSYCVEFQCGKKSYKFNQDTGFDGLCLNMDNPETTIKAITVDSKLKHLGNYHNIVIQLIFVHA